MNSNLINVKVINNQIILGIHSKLFKYTGWDTAEYHEGINLFYKTIDDPDDLSTLLDLISSIKCTTDADINHIEQIMYIISPKKEISQELLDVYDWDSLDKTKRIRLSKIFISQSEFSDLFYMDSCGFLYLKNTGQIIPKIMMDALQESITKETPSFSVKSILNFWKWTLLNPDKHIIQDLFKWISTGKWAITEDGMIISYRNVITVNEGNHSLKEFATQQWLKYKSWKKSPKNYFIHEEAGEYKITRDSFQQGVIGNLDDVFHKTKLEDTDQVFTDKYSKSMTIKIGKEVCMTRGDCDNDPYSSCSRGLHQKSKRYGLNLGDTVLVCLVNPYNIVAIPYNDNTKFRCCAYLPMGKADVKDGELIEWEAGSYDLMYSQYTEEKLEKLLSENNFGILQEAGYISGNFNTEEDFKSIFKNRIS